jgi:hypothetical protein
VGISYLNDYNSKTTMLLGPTSLINILPNAINGFELHQLDEQSSLPHLTNNKIEDGFPGSAVLAFKYFLVRDKQNRTPQQTVAASNPSPYRSNNEKDYKPPTAM